MIGHFLLSVFRSDSDDDDDGMIMSWELMYVTGQLFFCSNLFLLVSYLYSRLSFLLLIAVASVSVHIE